MTSIIVFAAATVLLSILAVLNARQIAKDRDTVNGHAEERLQHFATVEVRRAWLRALGWAVFFVAMVTRLSMMQGQARTLTVAAIITIGFGVFVFEALWGRRVRHEMLWSEVEEDLVSESLHRIEESDEDRFSEKEEEQGDVRARLVVAAQKQHEKLDEILRLLREGK